MGRYVRAAVTAFALVFGALGPQSALAAVKALTQEQIDAQKQQEQVERDREERERDERVRKLRKAVDIYHRASLDIARGFVHPLVDYSNAPPPETCKAAMAPRTHAILIGADDIGIERFKLDGPVNDIDILSTLLGSLGVAEDNIHRLLADRATRATIAETFMRVLADVRCDDRVIVHFSGHSTRAVEFRRFSLLAGNDNPYNAEAVELGLSYDDIQKGIVADKVSFEPELRLFVDNTFNADNIDIVLLLNDDSERTHELMLGRDISDYIIAVRNRGAHAVTIVDAVDAAAASIRDRQREAGEDSSWSFDYLAPGEARQERPGLALTPGHGDYAAFYAAGPEETTPELYLPHGEPRANQRKFGLFSFVVANALASGSDPTPRSVAESIQQAYGNDGRRRPHPRVEASNPDLLIVAESRKPQSGESAIRILNPTPKRGAMMVDRQEIEIEGLVDWPSRVLGVHIDQRPANLDAEGRFSGKVVLKNGMNSVSVMAVTADSRLHPYTLEFVYEGDRKALEGEGKRFAVVIANQNYAATTGFNSLATPFADAEALTALLTGKYGFETEIRSANGAVVPLVLKDPTKRDIEIALHHVGKAVGEKDTVLVFYAGHGIFEPVTSTAYWVPADAEAGFEPSYLSAADISAAIQRMQAGSVIMISDSCYSGALIRGGGEAGAETIGDEVRTQALLRMQARRSRVVITSGNNEPVEDLGGQGHSIFARALLTGLEKMEHDAFSARELFDGYILQAVTANADQEPQYRPLEKVGHEGGDFVFVRVETETATAD